MIGDNYRIKYSDYVLYPDGTDNGRYVYIDAADPVNKPGINPTNLTATAPTQYNLLDITLYGHRSQGYGAKLWNNMFYLLENFAQPSEAASTSPKYANIQQSVKFGSISLRPDLQHVGTAAIKHSTN